MPDHLQSTVEGVAEAFPKPSIESRETELAEEYPIHVVCAWIGNSEAVAKKHYLQVTDTHFRRVAQPPTTTDQAGKPAAKNSRPEKANGSALQIQGATQRRVALRHLPPTPFLQAFAPLCMNLHHIVNICQ